MLIIDVIKSVLGKKNKQTVYQVRDGKRFKPNETNSSSENKKIELEKTVIKPKIEEDNFSNNQLFNINFSNTLKSMNATSDKSIIESSLENDVFMKFSCSMGGCASCKVKLIKGKVDMKSPNCLTEEEISDGYILACVSYPLEDLVLEV